MMNRNVFLILFILIGFITGIFYADSFYSATATIAIGGGLLFISALTLIYEPIMIFIESLKR